MCQVTCVACGNHSCTGERSDRRASAVAALMRGKADETDVQRCLRQAHHGVGLGDAFPAVLVDVVHCERPEKKDHRSWGLQLRGFL
eukprot:1783440-Pleurochrysis_carterae.AAC.2